MSVSKLSNMKCCWSVGSYLSNGSVRNAMTRNRFINILQNLQFTNNETSDEFEKACKMRIVTNHVNKTF